MRGSLALVSILLPALGGLAPAGASTGPAGEAVVRVSPQTVTVSTFFHGSDLSVAGVAPAGARLAVLLTGARQAVELDEKGKVWGLLWMTVGTVTLEDVPAAYLLATAGPVCELAPYRERQRLGVGLDVLGTGSDGAREELFPQLIALKEGEGLYGTFEGDLEVRPGGGGWAEYSVVLPLPSRIPRGEYTVALWGFGDGVGRRLAEATVTVAPKGLTRRIAALARDHGLLYGFLALFIAVTVGMATGLVFGLAAKGGH